MIPRYDWQSLVASLTAISTRPQPDDEQEAA